MPASALDSLISKGVEYPWLFELRNPSTGKSSHCGVLEFTSDEGFVLLPTWMIGILLQGNVLEDSTAYQGFGATRRPQSGVGKYFEGILLLDCQRYDHDRAWGREVLY